VRSPTHTLDGCRASPIGDDESVDDDSTFDEIETGAGERLIFFSDAVVAIAITLLALELPVPSGGTTRQFWSSVRENSGAYIAFLISFAVISAYWAAHHRTFRYLMRADDRLRELNTAWLLAIVLMPFATKLLNTNATGADQTHALRFSFYALVQVIAGGAFLAMVHRMATNRLVISNTPPDFVRRANWALGGVIAGFALSIPIFFAVTYAWALWIIGPVTADLLRVRSDKRRQGTG
jgi:uncharacterized membrane protein